MPTETFDARGRPRIWQHDYLHLRPLARDLAARAAALGRIDRVLDVGSGGTPYRMHFVTRDYLRVDFDPEATPDVVARAEALPFPDGVFDVVVSTQLLGLVDDPAAFAREIARVVRPGGAVLVSAPAAWPYDSARVEHRFGRPQLPPLFPGLTIREIVRQGGLLALPFAAFNTVVREAAIAARRRLGVAAAPVGWIAVALFVAANVAGRVLERLAERGPLAAFLGYLDARLPMNWLVVAERAS
ncbi:MAG TPA: class I SAM-dependent methyltransferase [Candidatus Polarisedimenticolaceae bacterium]